jgi:hypothetical protein
MKSPRTPRVRDTEARSRLRPGDRHLRIFTAARTTGPAFSNIPARTLGLIRYAFVQTKMFKDPRAGLMHFGIFWGFVLLTIGTANAVTGGIIQTVLSIPFDGLIWAAISAMQNVVAVIVLGAILWAFERRLISKPERLTYSRDGLLILAMIGGLVRPSSSPGLRDRRLRRVPGAFIVFSQRRSGVDHDLLAAAFGACGGRW